MLKHIASKCRFCDPAVRNAVNELQRQQTLREGLASASGRPRYGSRKIFFQRIWARLHGGQEPTGTGEPPAMTTAAPPKVDISLQEEVAAAVAAEAEKINAEVAAGDKRKAEELAATIPMEDNSNNDNKKVKPEDVVETASV